MGRTLNQVSWVAMLGATVLGVQACSRDDVTTSAAEAQPVAATPVAAPVVATPNAAATGRVDVSATAAKIVLAAEEARRAIAAKNKDLALQHVTSALQAAERLNPLAVAPIYSELETVSIVAPVTSAKKATGTPVPSAITGVIGGYTRLTLDLNNARLNLGAARMALERDDFVKADRDLLALESGVVLESVATNLPLVRARSDLGLARAAATAGQYDKATASLKAAANGLAAYGATSQPHAADAKALGEEVNTASLNLTRDREQIMGKIDGWWNRVADWIDQPA